MLDKLNWAVPASR